MIYKPVIQKKKCVVLGTESAFISLLAEHQVQFDDRYL
jgi:hypothetical protein